MIEFKTNITGEEDLIILGQILKIKSSLKLQTGVHLFKGRNWTISSDTIFLFFPNYLIYWQRVTREDLLRPPRRFKGLGEDLKGFVSSQAI